MESFLWACPLKLVRAIYLFIPLDLIVNPDDNADDKYGA